MLEVADCRLTSDTMPPKPATTWEGGRNNWRRSRRRLRCDEGDQAKGDHVRDSRGKANEDAVNPRVEMGDADTTLVASTGIVLVGGRVEVEVTSKACSRSSVSIRGSILDDRGVEDAIEEDSGTSVSEEEPEDGDSSSLGSSREESGGEDRGEEPPSARREGI